MRNLIVGCGYLGSRVATAWKGQGTDVTILTRSVSRASTWSQKGFATVIGDVLTPDSLRWLPDAETVLYAVGFDRTAAAAKRDVYVNGLKNVLTEIAPRCRQIIYISSTSVFGQNDGSEIDESSPAEPIEENGRICRDAEQVLWELCDSGDESGSASAVNLRLAGIYGPGRLLTRIDQLRRAEPLGGNPDAWLNLIHVDDAVQAVLAAEQFGQSGETYLVADNRPLRRSEYYSALAERVGASPIRFAELAADAPERRNLNKRCANARLKRELRVELRYPTVIEGFESLPELSQPRSNSQSE